MKSILVVEDEYLQADDCAKLVEACGFRVIGPFGSVGEAEEHLAEADGPYST
ncbi:hypothetical protein [Bradyrhizobium sp. USDA 4353]